MKRFLVILILALFPVLTINAGTIKGKVTDADTGKPIAGANIVILGSKYSATSNARGAFAMVKIPGGKYRIQASKSGFVSSKPQGIKLSDGKSSTVNFHLKKKKKQEKALKPHKPASNASSRETLGPKLRSNPEKPAPKKPSVPDQKENEDMDVEIGEVESHEFHTTSPVTPPVVTAPLMVTSDRGETAEKRAEESMGKSSSRSSGEKPKTTPKPKTAPAPKKKRFKFFGMDADEELPARSVAPKLDESIVVDSPPRRRTSQAPGLKAGYADDNKQFNYFLHFLSKFNRQVDSYEYDISERIHLILQDETGKSLPNVEVKVFDKASEQLLDQGKTYSDGSFFLFPSELAAKDKTFNVGYTVGSVYSVAEIKRNGPRKVILKADRPLQSRSNIPVDIVFILDTTGSMGEEIKRLIATIDMIHMNLTSLPNLPEVRFGMVLYKDIGDEYVTRIIEPTADIEDFRNSLERVEADGGGDTPEDLQSALEKAMLGINWNSMGLRLGFVITDAPAHLDYGQEFTYIKAALEAKKLGIKLFTVGTGGLDIRGEYILRQIAQLTYAKYLFLTYGKETGENEGGIQGSVSHHTGSNYQTDKLDALILRLAKEEISNFTGKPFENEEEYFQAEKVDHETREETLALLFHDAVKQLVDYSSIKIQGAPKLGVLPVISKTGESELSAEYFSAQLQLAVSTGSSFTMIARKDLQQILEEQKLQLSGLLNETETIQLGHLLGAELLLSGELYEKATGYDLFLKLLRVETAEVLAVTKIILDKDLGL